MFVFISLFHSTDILLLYSLSHPLFSFPFLYLYLLLPASISLVAPKPPPSFHQFALLVCVLWKWIGRWDAGGGGGYLFVPRSGTSLYPTLPIFVSFAGEGENSLTSLGDKEDANGVEVHSGLSTGESKKLKFITSHNICSKRRNVFNMFDENRRD
jgi:hypothetical protein